MYGNVYICDSLITKCMYNVMYKGQPWSYIHLYQRNEKRREKKKIKLSNQDYMWNDLTLNIPKKTNVTDLYTI